MKKNKILMLLCGLMALLVFLAACDNGGDDAPAGNDGGGDTAGGTDEASGDVEELTVWFWDPAFNGVALEHAERVFQETHPNFRLNMVEQTEIDVRLATVLGAGSYDELPDIILVQDFGFIRDVLVWPNFLIDLTDFDIPWDEFAPGKLAESTVDGRHFGVPFDQGTVIAAYRVDILEQAGFTIDDLTDVTWNEFIEVGREVLAQTGHTLFSHDNSNSDFILQTVQSAGGSIWHPDGTPYLVGNDILATSIEIYRQLWDEGILTTINSWDEYIASFTTGTTAGVLNGVWILGSVQSAEELSGYWRMTHVPALPGIPGASNYSNQGGSSWAITSNASNPEFAAEFLAATFGGSVELYEEILPLTGAIGTWLPAADSPVYGEPQEFWGGQSIFEMTVDFSSRVPGFYRGLHYTELNGALAVAIVNIVNGGDVQEELAFAEEAINFAIGQ